MKKKFRLPILLLAVVVMMSVFYIHEANQPSEPVDSPNLEMTTTNPEYAEARLRSIEEVNSLIEESEAKIASGTLSLEEVEKENEMISSLKETKMNEIALEEMIMASLNFDDVLVLLEEEYIVIDVYTEDEITTEVFISVSRLAKEKFDENYIVKLVRSTSDE